MDEDTTVYVVSTRSGKPRIHTDSECFYLTKAKTPVKESTRRCHPNKEVCCECAGTTHRKKNQRNIASEIRGLWATD